MQELLRSIFSQTSKPSLVLRVFGLSFCTFVVACSTKSSKERELLKSNSAKVTNYRLAKDKESSDPNFSCGVYKGLSQDQEFTLKDFALYRQYLICAEITDQPISDEPLKTQAWLTPLWAQAKLKEARIQKDPARLAMALIEVSKYEVKTREKLALAQEALANAELTEDASLIAEVKNRLYVLAPRFLPNPKPTDYLRIGQDFLNDRQFERARFYFRRASQAKVLTQEERYLAQKSFRQSYKVELDKVKYIHASENLLKKVLPSHYWQRVNEAFATLARAQWTEGHIDRAKKVLARAEKTLSGKYPLDEIYWIRGRMAEEVGDYALALSLFDKAAAEQKPEHNAAYKTRVLFSKAWALKKMEKYPEAAEQFSVLYKNSEDNAEKAKSLYWRATSLKQAGQATEAQETFKQLTIEDPLGYYGSLAYRESKLNFPPLASSQTEDLQLIDRISTVTPERHRLLMSLAEANEPEIFQALLNQSIGNDKNEEQQLYYLRLSAKAGLYLPLFVQLNLLTNEKRLQLFNTHPELIFPMDYRHLIDQWALKLVVEPALVFSIIRQESAFNPYARSPVDAFGLMQILPSAARNQTAKTGVSFAHFEDLYRPEINIPLGISLLSDIQGKVKNQFILTVATYNANEKAIRNWLSTRLKNDPVEFIEDIPYEETRGYIKLVLRNFIFYSRLLNPKQSFAFPEWCLQGLQKP